MWMLIWIACIVAVFMLMDAADWFVRRSARRALLARLDRECWRANHPFVPAITPTQIIGPAWWVRSYDTGAKRIVDVDTIPRSTCRRCGTESDRRFNGLCPSCYR